MFLHLLSCELPATEPLELEDVRNGWWWTATASREDLSGS